MGLEEKIRAYLSRLQKLQNEEFSFCDYEIGPEGILAHHIKR